MRSLRIATRGSALARWQAEHVAGLLRAAHPRLEVDLVVVSTEGDRRTDVPIAEIGGKGVFAKEVQAAVLDGRADVAVHSAKDLPAVDADGLRIGAVPERGDARDALVGATLDEIVERGVVATGSRRRRVQLAALRPDLTFAELRGNMHTRLDKVASFDAIVVGAVALDRLGLAGRIAQRLSPEELVPQVGQGSLAVECRAEDPEVAVLLAAVEHPASRTRLEAERAFLATLGGDCDLPAGAHATLPPGGGVVVDAVLAPHESGPVRRARVEGVDAVAVGREAAERLVGAP